MFDELGMEILVSPVYDEEGKPLTEWDETKGWVDFSGMEQTESGAWVQSGIYHPYTEAELAEREAAREAEYRNSPEYRIKELEAALDLLLGVNDDE